MGIVKAFKKLFTQKGGIVRCLSHMPPAETILEDKIRIRVAELFADLEQKGFITINGAFTWKVEYNAKTRQLKIFHNEAMTEVDDMLEEIGVTHFEHESKNN
jgi:hypothetical protein